MEPLPILLYHTVDDDPPGWIAAHAVTRRTFARQLDEIVAGGRRVVPLDQAVAALAGGPPLPAKPLVLTFDDGFLDFYDVAYPALAERGLPATLYATTGALAGSTGSRLPPARMLSWRQLAELDDAGVQIGCHTLTHPQLDTLSRRAAAAEITESKRRLEDMLGHPITAFAYPYGLSAPAVRRLVRESGFTSATAVLNAFTSAADDLCQIARLTVLATTSQARFRSWLDGTGAPVAPKPEHLATKAFRSYRRGRVLLHTRRSAR